MKTDSNSSTYIFEGHEVRKTGRTAKREIERPRNAQPVIFYLYEVTPIDGTGWCKWVKPEDLYIVEESAS